MHLTQHATDLNIEDTCDFGIFYDNLIHVRLQRLMIMRNGEYEEMRYDVKLHDDIALFSVD